MLVCKQSSGLENALFCLGTRKKFSVQLIGFETDSLDKVFLDGPMENVAFSLPTTLQKRGKGSVAPN